MIKRALISVSDKTNLPSLLEFLESNEYQIISTGGTANFIREQGFVTMEVSDLTAFPEILSGRVKTLHPKILAGILARDCKQDRQEIEDLNINTIDLVVVNLYPFAQTVNQGASFAEVIEQIDIGGPTLLRSAAKNHKTVTVLSQPDDYGEFINTASNHGFDSLEFASFREKQATAVFAMTAVYDTHIANYFKARSLGEQKAQVTLPSTLDLKLNKVSDLRYGENPHQNAALYSFDSQSSCFVEQLHGKEISFNNYLDMQAAWNIVCEYESDIPCAAVIKHNNPCGVAIAPSAAQAFADALSTDTVSAFGGIVAFNVSVDLAAANELSQLFLEVIIAPDFSSEAKDLLKLKKNLRLIKAKKPSFGFFDIKSIDNGVLVQDFDTALLDKEKLEVVTQTSMPEQLWVDLIFAWKVVKHVKSNAVVLAKNGKTLGIGCGQTNRVKAVADALSGSDFDSRDAVLASDGFFPFADNIDLAAQNNIAAIIQPGGSIRDKEVIEACDKAGIAMAFTGLRHFKH